MTTISSSNSTLALQQQMQDQLALRNTGNNKTGVLQPDVAVNGSSNAQANSATTAKATNNPQSAPVKSLNNTQNTALDKRKAAAEEDKEVARATEALKKAVEPMTDSLQFSVDKESGRTVVTIIDNKTKEVIRQLPSKEMLELAKSLDRMQGLLFHGKA